MDFFPSFFGAGLLKHRPKPKKETIVLEALLFRGVLVSFFEGFPWGPTFPYYSHTIPILQGISCRSGMGKSTGMGENPDEPQKLGDTISKNFADFHSWVLPRGRCCLIWRIFGNALDLLMGSWDIAKELLQQAGGSVGTDPVGRWESISENTWLLSYPGFQAT